jgi:hypothetical protein
MDSHTLTVEQAAKLKQQIAPTMRYLNALVRRMERMGFPADDDLYHKAVRARDDVQALWMAEHYLSIPGGVFGPAGK